MRFGSVYVVHPYSSIDAFIAWNKCHFILSDKSDYHMTNKSSIAIHIFVRRILTSHSLKEMLLPTYENVSIIFKALTNKVDVATSRIKIHELSFICVNVEANASCSLL